MDTMTMTLNLKSRQVRYTKTGDGEKSLSKENNSIPSPLWNKSLGLKSYNAFKKEKLKPVGFMMRNLRI